VHPTEALIGDVIVEPCCYVAPGCLPAWRFEASEYLPIEFDKLKPDDLRDCPIEAVGDVYDFEFCARASS